MSGYFFKTTDEIKNESSYTKEIEVDVVAEATGPITIHNKEPLAIMTPVSGWSHAVGKDTYETGRLDETDDELRRRRIDELRADGSATADAIAARLRDIPHVKSVYIKEDARSFEAFINGGDENEIGRCTVGLNSQIFFISFPKKDKPYILSVAYPKLEIALGYAF